MVTKKLKSSHRFLKLPTFLMFFALSTMMTYATPTSTNGGTDDERRIIEFAGRSWVVKEGLRRGPGNNNWSDSPQSVWVDDEGKLHLRIRNVDGVWYSAQIISVDDTSYGQHRFFVETPLHEIDENVILGLFLYQDDHHELDIEISRQGQPEGANAKFVVQPYHRDGHRESFALDWDGSTIHEIDWTSESVRFAVYEGGTDNAAPLIHEWVYEGGDIPDESRNLYIEMNIWLTARAPANGEEIEVVISDLEAPDSSDG
jgi:hypothetical protein